MQHPGFSLAAGLATVGLLLACSRAGVPDALAPQAVVAAPAAACPRADKLERSAIEAEVTCLLQQLVRIDTTNPPGNELAAARFLRDVLEREGIAAELIEPAPGRANLIARLKGTESGHALMLMHHLDVVPASADEWSVPPFAGALKDGYVWGRGSFDNKGTGVAELVTLLLYQRLGTPPPRDLVLLALADEESGGGFGSRWLTEQRKDLFQDVELILNEGGGILELPGGKLLYTVELAQKAPLWLRVTARGPAGHGSAPAANPAAAVLVRALARLSDHRFELVVVPEVQRLFSQRAASMPEAERARYTNLQASLRDPAFRERFLADPHDAALVRTTLAITMLAGSAKENVISERASAVLDVRLLPGQDPAAVTNEIKSALGEPSLELDTILSWQAQRSEPGTPLFAAIERLAAERHPGAPVTTNVIGGFTDCNAFRAQGKTCYGFLPMQVTLDDVGRIHGKDERIRVSALSESVLALHALIRSLSTAPSSPPPGSPQR